MPFENPYIITHVKNEGLIYDIFYGVYSTAAGGSYGR